MKTIYNCWIVLSVLLLATSYNDEWTEEQYKQYISFAAPINDQGVMNIYVRYKTDGKVTYKLPLTVSGTTMNSQDLDVHVAIDPDTLNIMNQERFSTRTELFYELLDEKFYSFSESVHIPADSYAETMNIDFTLNGIDMVEKWVLPLTIVDDASYNYMSHPRKNYAKALLRVIPFNDYSGSYSTTTMEVFFRNPDGSIDKKPMVANSRTAYVVDENTIFFYAGLVGENLDKEIRRTYKIYMQFDQETKTLKVWPEDDRINFELFGTPDYSVAVIKDATRPYLEHHYVSFSIEYNYDDITSAPGAIVPYKVKGTLTLERNINTQIPDEDQQIEW